MSYIFKYNIDEKLLYINKAELSWVLESNNKKYFIEQSDVSMYLLPLLGERFIDFRPDVPKTFWERFPLKPLLKFPFLNKMDYWCVLALDWFQESSLNKDDGIKLWANSLDTDWMSQKLKHRFWKTFNIRSYKNPTQSITSK